MTRYPLRLTTMVEKTRDCDREWRFARGGGGLDFVSVCSAGRAQAGRGRRRRRRSALNPDSILL